MGRERARPDDHSPDVGGHKRMHALAILRLGSIRIV